MRWHVIHATAPNLSALSWTENFDFSGRTLTGAKENQPRWKRACSHRPRAGRRAGTEICRKEFPPEAKARALEMVHNLIAALHDDLQTLAVDEPRNAPASPGIKLDAMTIKIGYPDKWRDYSALPRGSRAFRGEYDA